MLERPSGSSTSSTSRAAHRRHRRLHADFPVSTMLPMLCRKYGTRSTSLESLLKCEHKFWSRCVQREAVPDHVPAFTAFDPFEDGALRQIGDADLAFPFFVKPIKSSGSRLGFRIDNPEDFDYAIQRFRAEIGSYRRALPIRARPRRPARRGPRHPGQLLHGRAGHRRPAVHGGGLCARGRGRVLWRRRLDPLPAGAELLLLHVPVEAAGAMPARRWPRSPRR